MGLSIGYKACTMWHIQQEVLDRGSDSSAHHGDDSPSNQSVKPRFQVSGHEAFAQIMYIPRETIWEIYIHIYIYTL